MPGRGTGFTARYGLLAAASIGAMAEAALLATLAPAARSLAPQVTALAPLSIFHDLRWLYAFGGPWPVFALLVAAFLAARSGWNAVLARLAWPAGHQPPPMRTLMWSSLTLTAFAALILSPVVTIMFGVAVVPFSWPFLASLAAMLLVAIPLSHGGVLSAWWQSLPPLTAICWLLADFAVLSVAAGLIGDVPPLAAIPVAGVAGLVNARAWYGMTAAVVRPGIRSARHLPLAALAVVTTLALVVGITWLGFLVGVRGSGFYRHPHLRQVTTRVAATPQRAGGDFRGRPVLEIAGFGLSCCSRGSDLQRMLPHRLVQQFSYVGLTRSGQPIPHGPRSSNLPLTVLGNRVTAQVRRLHQETGRRVDVVAESEGTLGVDAMLAQHPDVPVGAVVLLSPIVTPAQDGHASFGGTSLRPVAGGELRAVVWLVGGLSPFGTSGAETFVNSVGSDGARFAAAANPRLANSLSFLPLADAVAIPACRLLPNVQVVSAFHGELLGDPAVLSMVRTFLANRSLPAKPGLRRTAEMVAAAATAWRIPETGYPSPPCRS